VWPVGTTNRWQADESQQTQTIGSAWRVPSALSQSDKSWDRRKCWVVIKCLEDNQASRRAEGVQNKLRMTLLDFLKTLPRPGLGLVAWLFWLQLPVVSAATAILAPLRTLKFGVAEAKHALVAQLSSAVSAVQTNRRSLVDVTSETWRCTHPRQRPARASRSRAMRFGIILCRVDPSLSRIR